MTSAERQQKLVDTLAAEGRLSVAELAKRFAVSDDTIRRDLSALSAEGVVSKVHGSAVALDVPAMGKGGRHRVQAPAKQALGRAAAALVQPGMTLMLDAGQTVLAVAQALPDVPLTVVTHSLDIAMALSDRPRVRLILGGGVWNHRQRLFEGPAVEALVASCRADIAFLGACAVDPVKGVTATDSGDAEIKRSMITFATQRVLLADHTKWAALQPWFVSPLATFDYFFTDQRVEYDGSRPQIVLSNP